MAYSSTLYSNQTAGKTDFTLVFSGFGAGYIDSSHVKLYRDDVLQDGGFTFTDETNVVLTTPTVEGENILFRRETPKDAPLVNFDLDTVLTDTDLDTISLQMLYIAHEVLDGYITLGSAGYTSFNGRRLTEVGDGTLDTDGVNLAQVLSLINDEVLLSALEADEILARLVTVDGAGSGVDADLLDGKHGTFYATNDSVEAIRDLSVSSSVTYTIGPGGDFATHSAAFRFLADKHPVHTPAGVRVTLHTLSGYLVNEQILIDGKDFGWVALTGADATTYVNPSACTTEFTSILYGITSYPFIGVRRGGVGPVLKQTFRFSTTTAGLNLCGIVIAGTGSRMNVQSGGVTHAGTSNLCMLSGASCHITSGLFNYAGDTNIDISNSTLIAETLTASHSGNQGLFCTGSVLNGTSIVVSFNGGNGMYIKGASRCDIQGTLAKSNTGIGIYVDEASMVNIQGSDVYTSGVHGVAANNGSIVNAMNVAATVVGTTSIKASNGSLINANGTRASSLGSYEYHVSNYGVIDISDYALAARCNLTQNTFTAHGCILD